MPTRPPRAKAPGTPPPRKPRPNRRALGYDTAWDKARKDFLAKHPRCECLEHRGKPDAPPATFVDHIIPHKGDNALFWDRKNWQALTRRCSAIKTNRYDGGFGNKRRPYPTSVTPTDHTASKRAEPRQEGSE